MIDSAKCDGCKSCSLACMQAHRETPGTIYDLDVTDCANESRNFIYKNQKGGYTPLFCRHCDKPECVMSCMSGALTKDEKTGHVAADVPQQVQHLHLYRDIQRAHGLVQHQKGRPCGQRPRDAGPLYLSAAEFVRQAAGMTEQ